MRVITVIIPVEELYDGNEPDVIAQAPLEWTNVLANVVYVTPADAIDRDAVVQYEVENDADADRVAEQARWFSWTVRD